MPKGIPTAEQLMSGAVSGFSIDTCVFESLGFRLDAGELGVLSQQLPPWLKLFLPRIVKREVIGHQVENVLAAEQELKKSLRNIHRYSGLDVGKITSVADGLQLSKTPKLFEERLENYVNKFGGAVIEESGDGLLQEMFERYFNVRPPFEAKKDKKCEFPDAASLLALEYFAKKRKKLFVLVSNDEGWKKFCEQSEVLFCVQKLEDLTALYQAKPNVVDSIEKKIIESLEDDVSKINKAIEAGLEKAIPDCSWVVDAYTGYCSGIEAELDFAEFKSFVPNVDSLRLWLSDNEEEICVVEVEVKVDCNFGVSAEFSAWDSIDHENVPIGMGRTEFSEEVEMTIYLTLSGNLSKGGADEWGIQFEVSQEDYYIDAGEMEPDYSSYEE